MDGDVLEELGRLTDQLTAGDSDRDLADVTDAAVAEELITLRSVIDKLEAGFVRRLRRFDEGRGCRTLGSASTVSWLKSAVGMTPGAASERVRIARQMEHLPATTEGLASGDLPYGHVAVIARVAEDVGADDARAAEQTLLQAAEKLRPDQLRKVGDRLRNCVDPDGCQLDANRAHQRRRLHVSRTIDGLVVLDGLLDPESGAVVRTALDAATSVPNPEDGRTPAQRRADALTELCERVLGSGQLPEVGGLRPHLTVTAGVGTLAGAPAAPPADVENGPSLPGESARRIACDATLTRVVLDGNSQPIDVGRATRIVPPPMRRALAARDGGCVFPGCDRPPGWTDAHHRVHWTHGGSTALPNLLLLCRVHHRLIHDHGWILATGRDGTVTVESPNGGPVTFPGFGAVREKRNGPRDAPEVGPDTDRNPGPDGHIVGDTSRESEVHAEGGRDDADGEGCGGPEARPPPAA